MNTAVFVALLSLISGSAGVIISYGAFVRQKRKEHLDTGHERGTIASDVGYIKAGVDDLKRETREQRAAMSTLSERVTRCEESCKQAHNRIDELKKE